jgi:hypothetical protein
MPTLPPSIRPLASFALAAAIAALLPGCAEDTYQEPRGGGYTEPPPRNMAEEPEAKSALGKAKQAAERLVNEDVAEYNRKLEEAADGVFEKKPSP